MDVGRIGHYYARKLNTWKAWFLAGFLPFLLAVKVDDPSLMVLVNFYMPGN